VLRHFDVHAALPEAGAWLSTDPQSTAFASLDAIDPTLPHREDNIQW
jgi:hypothetical protein